MTRIAYLTQSYPPMISGAAISAGQTAESMTRNLGIMVHFIAFFLPIFLNDLMHYVADTGKALECRLLVAGTLGWTVAAIRNTIISIRVMLVLPRVGLSSNMKSDQHRVCQVSTSQTKKI